MIFKKIIIVSFLFLVIIKSFSQDKTNTKKQKPWYIPEYTTVQVAGNIGFLSTGVGYKLFDDAWYAELLYGYVPAARAKAESIHLITIKNTFPIFSKEIGNNFTISPIAGLGITYHAGTKTFTTLPSRFPRGYYVSNAIHFTLFGGVNLHKKFKSDHFFKGADLYYELGTVESYLWFVITSSEVSVSEAFSSAIGVRLYF